MNSFMFKFSVCRYAGGALANIIYLQLMCSIGYMAFIVFASIAAASGL
jgi:hypothetical protein